MRVGSALQEHREQRIFLGTRRLNLVNLARAPGVIEIGAQHRAVDTGHAFNRYDALGRNPAPIRYGRLRNAEFSRESADAASSTNGLVKTRIAHSRLYVLHVLRS